MKKIELKSISHAVATAFSRWRSFSKGFSNWALTGVGLGFLALLVLAPLGYMFGYAASTGVGVFWAAISSPEALFSLKFSLLLAVATTAINAAMGTLVAFMLVRREFPFKGFFDSVIDLPIAIPAAVTGFTLLLLYSPVGMLGKISAEAGVTIMFAFPGILLAHTFMTLPYVVRAVGPVLQEMDKSQEEAAQILGANSLQIFTRIILPSIKGGLIAGSVFTFARSLGEFGATIMVSGNLALRTQTAPLFIFSEFNKGNIEAACSMSVILVIISFVLFLGFKVITKISGKGGTKSAKRDIP